MPSLLHIQHACKTDVGIRRSHNQDAYASQPAKDEAHFKSIGHVFVVADGMGGHAVGEKASAKAVRDIPLTFQKLIAGEGPIPAIRKSIVETNAAIHQIGQNNPEFKGLGTTGSALFLRPEGAWVGHVGDSRVYRIRGDKVQQLTFDHSWVWEIARRQGIDPDELGDFKKNVIIRSLGPEAEVEVDVEGPHPILPGDAFLMCSDGLTNHVKNAELGAVVATMTAQEACDFLIELANIRGGSDNITCLIVRVPGADGTSLHGFDMPKQSPINKALRWWGKKVTWPLTGLGFGGFLVAVSIVMRSEKMGGAMILFLLAAAITIAGLVGLARQFKSKVDEGSGIDDDEDAERELHIFKETPFAIDKVMYDAFLVDEKNGLKMFESAGVEISSVLYAEAVKEAEAAAKNNDWLKAFEARCRALKLIATPLNASMKKDEAFKPNWKTPPTQ